MTVNNLMKILIEGATIILIIGCSSRETVETVTFKEYKTIEHLRGQPPKIYVRATDSNVYIFSHSNYYIQNDTLFGKDNSGLQPGNLGDCEKLGSACLNIR